MSVKEFIENVKIEINTEKEPYSEVLDDLINVVVDNQDLNNLFDETKKPESYNEILYEPEGWKVYDYANPPESEILNPLSKKSMELIKERNVRISLFDILGEYYPDEKKIILYEENIKKVAEHLKDNLLKIFLWLGAHPVSKNYFHFPVDYFFAYFALKESLTFKEFVNNLIKRWAALFGPLGPSDGHKKELLTFDEKELFEILKDLTLMHEAGHALHHALIGDKFKNIEDYVKEGLADLNALFSYDSIKHKVVFFSFKLKSYQAWFYYYREAYKEIYNSNLDNIDFFKEIWNKFKEKDGGINT